MAEAVFRSLSASSPKIRHIDSAGTSGYNIGCDPDERTLATLAEHGITNYTHSARRIQSADFTKFDYIMAMDRENLYDLKRLRDGVVRKKGEEGVGKVVLFGHYGGGKDEEIDDPYYGALDGFETAYGQAVRFSKGFLKEVLEMDMGV
jgi:low molecular weight phosphotyrosine protein phosphatase